MARRVLEIGSGTGIANGMEHPIHKRVLENEATLLFQKLEGIDSGIYLTFPYGDVDQVPHAHFLEHMMFRANRRFSSDVMDRKIEGDGKGAWNAQTYSDSMSIEARVSSNELQAVLEILYNCMAKSRFRQEELETERQVVVGELNARKSEPAYYLNCAEDEVVFANHPLNLPRETKETILAITRDELFESRRKYIGSRDLVIGITGPHRIQNVIRDVEKTLGNLPNKGNERHKFKPSKIKRFENVYRRRGISDSAVSIAFPICGIENDDRLALYLLNHVLAGTDGEYFSTSRLGRFVRKKSGLSYSLEGEIDVYEGVGKMRLRVSGMMSPSLTSEARDIMLEELSKLTDRDLREQEFTHVVGSFLAHKYRERREPLDRAEDLATSEFYGKPLKHADFEASIGALTPADLKRVAKKYFNGNYFIGTLKPA